MVQIQTMVNTGKAGLKGTNLSVSSSQKTHFAEHMQKKTCVH